jgi:hypothetical protein
MAFELIFKLQPGKGILAYLQTNSVEDEIPREDGMGIEVTYLCLW